MSTPHSRLLSIRRSRIYTIRKHQPKAVHAMLVLTSQQISAISRVGFFPGYRLSVADGPLGALRLRYSATPPSATLTLLARTSSTGT